jgi:dimethylhistidine N-methyltransferase
MNKQFAKDVQAGLTSTPKKLSSKYFYDEKGSALFSKIMKLPEYYLTNAEFEIFEQSGVDIVEHLGITPNQPFDLIELGAGDGYKTIELLKTLETGKFQYNYTPIDISKKALSQIEENIKKEIPDKAISPKQGDYFHILHELKSSSLPKVLLFLGSNIGNMEDVQAQLFLSQLSDSLNTGDKVLLGVDLKKSRSIILPAYNDSKGFTRDFNLNLLRRINREFNADFDLNQFEHIPSYDENEGIAKSAIRSKLNQKVTLHALDMIVQFDKGEDIHTEISRKYDDEVIRKICLDTGLKSIGKLTDSKRLFADYILEKE